MTRLSLADVVDISAEPLSRDRQGVISYVATGDVSRTAIESSTDLTVEARPSRANLIATAGDILIAKMASTIKVVIVTEISQHHVFSTGFARLRPKSDQVDTSFLAHWLRSEYFQKAKDALATGATQRAITDSALARTPFPDIALQRQREIASALNACEKTLEAKAKTKVLLNELDESLIAETFVNSQWPLASIASLGSVTTGRTPPTSSTGMFDGPVPFVTPGDLSVSRPAVRTLTEAGANRSRRVRAGSTLVCCIGATIGKTDIAISEIAFNQQINAIEWSDQVDDLFGLAAMRFLKPAVVAAGASTTLPLLPKSRFSALEIPVAPKEAQIVFAKKYAAIRDLMFSIEREIELARELLASTQEECFSGRYE